ncbi:tetratricopeptide repeat protein [Paraliomyxa miuraensis]|uniref:tetratricopeptide repeat protein n=1 Tax=Paraliomyxa miuraensis TaxID=376150 RepID=UPI002259C01B|nr:tetratricopeptide repeat protein [Paraliomyxa miuraensis]MCX4248020.1 tetratricopeptide repeat protein [Paraliomyxa miuraensis]
MKRTSLEAPRRRQPPPRIDPMADSGPPSIGLDDLGRHNELDLGSGGGSSLELDLAPPQPPEPISFPDDSGAISLEPEELGFELPGSVGAAPATVHEDSNAYAMDLPAPVAGGGGAPAFGRPPAPARAKAPPSKPAAPSRPIPPSQPVAGPPAVESLSFDDDLPAPAELDLPMPASARDPRVPAPQDDDAFDLPEDDDAFDLPTPVSAQANDALDLPLPLDLPAPGGSQMVTPVDVGLEPGGSQMVTPVDMGLEPASLEVVPADLNVRPKLAGSELAPHDLPSPLGALEAEQPKAERPPKPQTAKPQARPQTAKPQTAKPQTAKPASATAGASPPPSPISAASRPPVSRGLIIALGGVLVLGLAGAGVLFSGILDPEEPEPASLRGAGNQPPGKATDPKDPNPDGEVVDGELAERSAAVLAKMAMHTPEAYLEALTASREAGDGVGVAESALLLAFHFGPNPARIDEAAKALEPHAKNAAPFVQRVVGLSALVAGNHEGAEAALVGDEPRTRLYRGWLRLSQGRLDDAQSEARAVLSALPDELGARHLLLAVTVRRDPDAAVSEIQAALAKSPHPALQGLMVTAAQRTGQLVLARSAVEGLDPGATDEPGVKAWIEARIADARLAQGDADEALAAYDRALEQVPAAPSLQMARIRALMAAKRFNEASTAASVLVREHPQDQEAQLLQAEVAIQSGDGDIALQLLETLTAARPKDPRVMLAKGDVHAMRLEVDEGQAAYAAVRELDPLHLDASVHEAILLADAKRMPDALQVLRAALDAATAAPGRAHDVARLLIAKAKLHAKIGERNATLEALDRALEAAPGEPEALLMRGVQRLGAGREAEGRADLIAAFERTGGYPGLAGPLGRIYVRDGDFDALDRLVGDRVHGERTPDELLTLGTRLRLHQGRQQDARTLVDLALARRPSDWEAHMLLAQVLILEGNAVQALAEIERARPSVPQPELMLQRGKILEFNGRHDDAIPEYQRALSIDPELHEARFLYGRMLHYKGGHAKAITELRKVLDAPRAKAAPWYPEVWLNVGVAQQALGKHEEAIASLKQATDLDPELGEAFAKAGKFHEDRNKHAEAIAALSKAVEVGTKDDYWYADALMDLGRAQAKAGRKADARKSLEQFLKVAPPDHTSRAEAERLMGAL